MQPRLPSVLDIYRNTACSLPVRIQTGITPLKLDGAKTETGIDRRVRFEDPSL